jgi:hypothetical protein
MSVSRFVNKMNLEPSGENRRADVSERPLGSNISKSEPAVRRKPRKLRIRNSEHERATMELEGREKGASDLLS